MNGAAANPAQFLPPRELLDMVLEREHLLRTGEGTVGSGKPTYSLTTVEVVRNVIKVGLDIYPYTVASPSATFLFIPISPAIVDIFHSVGI
jgi:hypothetical protein